MSAYMEVWRRFTGNCKRLHWGLRFYFFVRKIRYLFTNKHIYHIGFCFFYCVYAFVFCSKLDSSKSNVNTGVMCWCAYLLFPRNTTLILTQTLQMRGNRISVDRNSNHFKYKCHSVPMLVVMLMLSMLFESETWAWAPTTKMLSECCSQ